MKQFFFNAIIGAIASHLLSSCAARPAPLPDGNSIQNHLRNKKNITVLFIGNSLSFGLPQELEKITCESGTEIHATLLAHSGWSLSQHLKNEETLQVLRSKRWDIVVLQEQSRIPSLPIKRRVQMIPAVWQFTREARAIGAMPVLYQTWGYRDGDRRRFHDDFFAMSQRLRDGYDVAARIGSLPVVRVGDLWESEVREGRSERLFMPDGLHPSREGVRLNAQFFYESLFSQAAPKNRKILLNAAKPKRAGG